MKNKNVLLSVLIAILLGVESWAFLSKPKVNVNKDDFFEEGLLGALTSDLRNDSSYENVLTTNEIEAKEELSLTEDNRAKEIELALELLGTAIGNIKDPIAFIKDLKSNKQGIYRLGSTIREAKVIKITLGEVVFDVNGRKETLKLSRRGLVWAKREEGTLEIISISGNQVFVNKNRLLSESGKIMDTLHNIKVKPFYESKKVTGMIVEGIAQDSLIAAAGIRNKDIVTAVNSQKIDSYQKALQVFKKARGQSEVKVSLLRDGQVLNLNYHLQN